MPKLFYLTTIILFVSYVDGQVDEIFGGNTAKKDQFPFFVEINIQNTTVEDYMIAGCGGTLIQPLWILTVAHCFQKEKPLSSSMFERNQLVASITSGTAIIKRLILQVHTHSKYTYRNVGGNGYIEYDVALAKLNESFEIKPAKKGIYLADKKLPVCRAGIIIGRGIVRYTGQQNIALQFTSVSSKVASQLTVLPEYPRNSTFYSEIYWHDGHPLVGDVGGPFLCYQEYKYFQYGIISGYYNNSLEQTSITEYESVVEYLDFIQQYVSLAYIRNTSRGDSTKKRVRNNEVPIPIAASSINRCFVFYIMVLFCIHAYNYIHNLEQADFSKFFDFSCNLTT